MSCFAPWRHSIVSSIICLDLLVEMKRERVRERIICVNTQITAHPTERLSITKSFLIKNSFTCILDEIDSRDFHGMSCGRRLKGMEWEKINAWDFFSATTFFLVFSFFSLNFLRLFITSIWCVLTTTQVDSGFRFFSVMGRRLIKRRLELLHML